jgi:M6 family metalloprotease-like protein
MKSNILKSLITITLLQTSIVLFAIKATPEPIKVLQPDGSELTILLRGDEFFKYRTTIDGFLIAKNIDGFYHYATFDTEGKTIISSVRSNELKKRNSTEVLFLKNLTANPDVQEINTLRRIQKSAEVDQSSSASNGFPLTGSPRSLVILVNFSDVSFTVSNPQVAFTNLLNQPDYSTNGGTGSARDYFISASNGVFSPQFDVIGPFTLPNNVTYYGGNDSSGNDLRPRQMVADACALADAAGTDFSVYDTDKDGYVDNIFIYYAGHNEAEGAKESTVWPHRWVVSNANVTYDGVKIYDYACTSELRGSSGTNMCGIGTFTHEFGHVLGLADYYATNDATHYTLQNWNIMDNGAYLNQGRTPPTYSAYDRFYLNWLRPTELIQPQNGELGSLLDTNKAYLISQYGNHNLNGQNPSPVEFFMLENRQKKGWDAYLPNSGLLITRIYYNPSTWRNNTVNNVATSMGVDIMEADGIASIGSAAGDVFPGTAGVTAYNPVLRSGVDIGKPLTFIKHENGIITFRFKGGGDVANLVAQNNLTSFKTVHGTASTPQSLRVSGNLLVDNVKINLVSKNHFEFKIASDENGDWVKSLTLFKNGNLLPETEILIRYNPTEPSFKATHTDNLTIETTDAEKIIIPLTGTSTRPVYVVPPIANVASDVTMSSFQANWEPVYDASGYYLTLYNISDGISEITEGFDGGLTPPAGWTILSDAVTASSTYSGKAIPAIQLKNTGDGIITDEYIVAPSTISAFVKSLAGDLGAIYFEAWNGTKWQTIDSVSVTSTLSEVKKITLNPADNYKKFKFTYRKGTGFAVIDDITVTFPYKLEINFKDKWLTETFDIQNDLIPDRKYFYKVKASDKTLYEDKTIKYENLTAFSNIIKVNTLKDIDSKLLLATPLKDGTVRVVVPHTGDLVNVYNAIGQKIQTLKATSNLLIINGLVKNQLYIITSGYRKTKIAL